MAPAMACVNRSSLPRGRKLIPNVLTSTMDNIVSIVTNPKTMLIRTRPDMLFCAAGYISIGISGSQGPRMKMTNNIQGVRFFL